jgi:hypothetical protein
VSGHSLEALGEVIEAIANEDGDRASSVPIPGGAGVPIPVPEEQEPPSATPVPGSSVAMPSGYGPSRGRTTPGWGLDGGE